MAPFSARDFYEQLSDDYHLIFRDWSQTVSQQGSALNNLIRANLRRAGGSETDDGVAALDILDCSCGIGTQAIGLAEHGHRVTGSDLSPAAARRAGVEAARRGRAVAAVAADMRELPFAAAAFDVVLSADNALAHLLTERDVRRAASGMRRVVRDGGLLVLTAKDYGDARATRRQVTVPGVTETDAGQVVTFQLWHWQDGGIYDFEHVQLVPDGDTWQVRVRRATSRAWELAELARLVGECGFEDVTWHSPNSVEFFQPVLTARPV